MDSNKKAGNKKHRRRWQHTMCLLFLACICLLTGGVADEKMGRGQDFWDSSDTGGQTELALQYVSATVTAKEAPMIAITFDDGPSAACTPLLLDELKKRKIKGTFFLIGENAEKNPELVQRIKEEGHLIGNHTYHHVELTRLTDEQAIQELEETNEILQSIIGEPAAYMRPPFGAWQRDLEQKLNMFPVMWTIDPLDWTTENVDEIVNKVVTEADENDIILLHDCYKTSVEAALRIVDILTEQGYEFVTVDELIMN